MDPTLALILDVLALIHLVIFIAACAFLSKDLIIGTKHKFRNKYIEIASQLKS